MFKIICDIKPKRLKEFLDLVPGPISPAAKKHNILITHLTHMMILSNYLALIKQLG